ncbi:MAG: glycosyltransferase family 8 protein [Desulfovibrio sp.]|jgi:lipopolysaccharide biosynthesis glycosyltransferase|nr:glycosyltransferase family 8 protein [Desulfovibrio sp.]
MKNEIGIVYPAFENNNIPVVFACDVNFVPYFSVALQSIIENSTENNNYDIILLYRNISLITQKMLINQINKYNFSIRFYEMENIFKIYSTEKFWVPSSRSILAYARLFIPIIFKPYEKILYLDSDIICIDDVGKLYNYDIGNNFVAASRDLCDIGISHNTDYLQNFLNIKCLSDYFNSGVCIFNISTINKLNIFDKFLEIAYRNKGPWADQNVLNAVCQGNVLFLDYTWNVLVTPFFYPLSTSMSKGEVENILNSAKILHYTTPTKPTDIQDNIIAQPWWYYAAKTPFYNQLQYISLLKIKDIIQDKITYIEHLLDDKLHNYDIELEYNKEQLRKVYASRSWRITKPLRYICKLLRYTKNLDNYNNINVNVIIYNINKYIKYMIKFILFEIIYVIHKYYILKNCIKFFTKLCPQFKEKLKNIENDILNKRKMQINVIDRITNQQKRIFLLYQSEVFDAIMSKKYNGI